MAEPVAGGRRENIFTHKFGPLPMWAWVGIIAAILVGWAWFKNRKQPSSSGSTADASQVPQFVNQTYTTVNPPSSSGSGTSTPGQVAVPNVVGMTDTGADAAIVAAGLKVGDKNEKRGGGGGGKKVVSQSPAANTMVARGSVVSITLEGQEGSGRRRRRRHPTGPPEKAPAPDTMHPAARARTLLRPGSSLPAVA